MLKFLVAILLTINLLSTPETVQAAHPEIFAQAAYLLDVTTGRTLFEKNGNQRVYPASMTKILTAMIALEYIRPNEVIFVGPEIQQLPPLSSRAGVSMREAIRGHNLIRLLMIPSGNEVAMVVAQNVAQRFTGRTTMPYAEAEQIFASMMNERAMELGATNSNFTNPHGFHHPNHFTTPSDFALIARAALEIPLLAEILSESRFFGNGATANRDTRWVTRYHDVVTRNQLVIETSPYFYQYATGMKTGFHDEAGETLAASAYRDGTKLIAMIFDSLSPGRWLDAIALFEYGFQNFEHRQVQAAGRLLGETTAGGVRLGYSDVVPLLANSYRYENLSLAELGRIELSLYLDPQMLALDEHGEPIPAKLVAPISEGQVLGKVVYSLDGSFLFSDTILAGASIYARSLNSDTHFLLERFSIFVFSLDAVPHWSGLITLACAVIHISRLANDKREQSYRRLPRTQKY